MGKSIYIATFVATLAIVLVLLFSVKLAEDSKASQFNEEIRQFALENELQSAYADFDTNNRDVYCAVVNQGIESLSKSAGVLEKQLETYKENSFNSQEFFLVKRNYLITNMVLYSSFLKAKSYCDLNTKAVIFFYAEDKSCSVDCGVIGSQLEELSRDCKSFRAFNFPYQWPSYEFTKILEVKYGINNPGTVVVDGNVFEMPVKFDDFSKKLGCS